MAFTSFPPSFRPVSPHPWLCHLTSAGRLSFLSPDQLSLHRLWPGRFFSCPWSLPSSRLWISFLLSSRRPLRGQPFWFRPWRLSCLPPCLCQSLLACRSWFYPWWSAPTESVSWSRGRFQELFQGRQHS